MDLNTPGGIVLFFCEGGTLLFTQENSHIELLPSNEIKLNEFGIRKCLLAEVSWAGQENNFGFQ